MMRVRVRYWGLSRPPLIAAALSVMLVACGGAAADRAAKNGATSIFLIDSVEVVETDSVFVARPNSIAVDASGRVYVSDGSVKRVLRVERDGSGLAPITRVGGGPGEVQRPRC